MEKTLEQYINIEKSMARIAGNPISDEEARRRAEARQKGATINLATGEIQQGQRKPQKPSKEKNNNNLQQYIRIEKSKARLAGNPISDEEARRRAEARQKGATINLATGEISYTQRPTTTRPTTPGAGFPRVTADTAERRAQQAAPTTTTGAPTTVSPTTDTTRPTTPGAGFPRVTADTAERRAQQALQTGTPSNQEDVTVPGSGDTSNIIDEDKTQRQTTEQIVKAMLAMSGFDNISNAFINKAIKSYNENPSQEYVVFNLRNEPEYKERFAGIEKLREENPAFTESDYIQEEKSYARVARDLPEYLRPTQKDYARFMELGVSPLEFQNRIAEANKAASMANPYFKEALRKNYGMTDEDIMAFYLDPTKTEEEIKKRQDVLAYDTSLIQQKVSVSTGYLEQLSELGKSTEQVEAAGYQVARGTSNLELLSSIEGTAALTQEEQLGAELRIDTEAEKRRDKLRSRERARFSQSGGGTRMFGPDLSASY